MILQIHTYFNEINRVGRKFRCSLLVGCSICSIHCKFHFKHCIAVYCHFVRLASISLAPPLQMHAPSPVICSIYRGSMLLHVGTQQAAEVVMSRLAKFKESGHYSTNSPGLLAFCNFTSVAFGLVVNNLKITLWRKTFWNPFWKAFYDPIEIPFEKVWLHSVTTVRTLWFFLQPKLIQLLQSLHILCRLISYIPSIFLPFFR